MVKAEKKADDEENGEDKNQSEIELKALDEEDDQAGTGQAPNDS